MSTFAEPKNEATVKFYTEVLKNRLGVEPNPFLPKKSARAHITRCLNLTQFNLHSRNSNKISSAVKPHPQSARAYTHLDV